MCPACALNKNSYCTLTFDGKHVGGKKGHKVSSEKPTIRTFVGDVNDTVKQHQAAHSAPANEAFEDLKECTDFRCGTENRPCKPGAGINTIIAGFCAHYFALTGCVSLSDRGGA